ncbi:SPOR domain-containing protein [Alteraurantiacibacter palmitatis]|uniref:SPOR domain-containing protein n=1 Tax=Alteraurantiacibacter palmitatis TaxID=2054628 RepID=A0ABV7E9P6_9SPHN
MHMAGGEHDGSDENVHDDAYEAGEQLRLTSDEDDALPWLESDEEEEEPASDYRILIFAALAVAALAAILFSANHFLSRQSAGDAVPDGSTIAAPEEPYKERPENPGGSEVAGTGDMSFEVGEGQRREGRIAGDAPAPSIDVEAAPTAAPTTGAGPAATPAPARAATGVGVQIGAYSTRAAADAGWSQLSGRYSALQGLGHRVVEGTADSGTIFRLQAIASDVEAANALCRSIRNAGGDCQVKR